jgi:hypothetical protein
MLDETQHGFRKRRSCIHYIFTINQITEEHREFNLPTLLAFVDYGKAFDKIIKTKLWKVTIDKGFPLHLIKVAQSLYAVMRIRCYTFSHLKRLHGM